MIDDTKIVNFAIITVFFYVNFAIITVNFTFFGSVEKNSGDDCLAICQNTCHNRPEAHLWRSNGCVKRSKISDSPTVNALSYSEFFRINYLPVGVASFYRGAEGVWTYF